MRNLASVQLVTAVEAIDGADAIERLRVLGWWLVSKKGVHHVGDAVVYCEVDSLLPERPEFEFLRKGCWRPAITTASGEVLLPAGFRIKTVRLRGQVSQGICFPLSILPEGAPTVIGSDVTSALGIVKYEPPVPVSLGGRIKGAFPGFVPRTDEPRVQVLLDVLARHRGKLFVMTEKLDGTSFTAFVRAGEYGVCSRNQWLDERDLDSGLVKVAHELGLAEKLPALAAELGLDLAIQGELIGPGIQSNRYALKQPALHVFNVVDLAAYRLLSHARMLEAVDRLGLPPVPQLGTLVLDHDVDALVELAMGDSRLNPASPREGIVLRPPQDESDPEIGRLSFKVINPKFLLKYDE